jgi:hypothetical protein
MWVHKLDPGAPDRHLIARFAAETEFAQPTLSTLAKLDAIWYSRARVNLQSGHS